ncbi:MAG: hypothetical protein HC800_03970 [Phormidesmis sp. RL_2_1]|nr:hypothetical protein [Phormidesmis sp. RL_2_1]
MHRLAATPGGWDATAEGVVFIEQTPAPIIVLTAADTDISALNQALVQLPQTFSDIRCVNLLQLQQQLTIDTYAESVLNQAKLIIVRVLGGRAYWSYGIEVVKAVADETGAALVIMPGDDRPDLDLMGHSTVPLAVVNQLWRYFTEGGIDNLANGLLYASDRTLATHYHPPEPKPIPKIGIYASETGLPTRQSQSETAQNTHTNFGANSKQIKELQTTVEPTLNQEIRSEIRAKSQPLPRQYPPFKTSQSASSNKDQNKSKGEQILRDYPSAYQVFESSSLKANTNQAKAKVGILFYRAHYLAGNTKVIDALSTALMQRQLMPVPIYVSSLKEADIQRSLVEICQSDAEQPVELLINTTSFAIAPLAGATASAEKPFDRTFNLWKALDVPVLQAICSSSPQQHWHSHAQGLTPRDIAMNVALPEVDGRIITRAVSFKAAQSADEPKAAQSAGEPQTSAPSAAVLGLQTDVVMYQPEGDRINFVADLAARWLRLRRTPPAERKIALVLANYPNRDGRMANGVGLDTPASCIKILQALQTAGYHVTSCPETGDELMAQLARGVTNDLESYGLRPTNQTLSISDYQQFFDKLPPAVKQKMTQRWAPSMTSGNRMARQHKSSRQPLHSRLPECSWAMSLSAFSPVGAMTSIPV